MSSLIVLFLGFVVMLNYGKGVAMEIAITPNKYDGVIPTSFNITCVPTVSRTCANSKMLAIQLSKNGSRPLVTLQHESVISYNRPILRSSIEAEGRIGNAVGESSKLTVVFSDVLREDSGLYACSALYFDEGGHLQHESATHNFTVEHQDVQDITRYLMGKLVAMEATLQNQKMQISRLEDKTTQYIQTDNQTSGFLAGPVATSSVVVNQVLKFSKVLENVGNDYKPKDGVYTAPVNGLYAFHLYGMVYGSGSGNKYIQVRIQDSDNPQLGELVMEDNDMYDQSSVSCVVKLQAGDRVWCRVTYVPYSTNGLYAFPHTGFTGHLIKAF